jgi:RNA polymerase sigma factor (sigma-70 family)
MATNGLDKVFFHLRRAVLLKDGGGQTDGKLLGNFIENRDETSFEVLMRRHGPMVLNVCRRILHNQQDAQDAVQTTFLVLVRKAKSVKPRELVGNWLHAVARQTAIRIRSKNAKRWWREKQVTIMPEPQRVNSASHDDLLILDQELSHLPEKYRIAIVLCDLEGKTQKQAARQLGWPEGTIGTRLARGRTMLAKRLAKHGLLFSVEALAAVLSQNLASASLPPTLITATVKAASMMVAGKTVATGLISAKVIALTQGVMKTMLLTKLKTLVLAVTVVGALGIGAGVYSVSVTAETQVETGNQGKYPNTNRAPAQSNEPGNQGKDKKKDAPHSDKDKLQGVWQMVSMEGNGEKITAKDLPAPDPEQDRVRIDGDQWITKNGQGKEEKVTFKLDESKTPKTINIKSVDGRFDQLGVYELDGDVFKVCLCGDKPSWQERPKDFATGKGSPMVLIVYKRTAQDQGNKNQKEAKDPLKEFTNSIGMKFVWIPPGSFSMGSPKEEKERGNDEMQHQVTLTKGFYMGAHLVTQEQWQAVMGNNPSYIKGEKNLPVETVSWDDCQEFIKKLREKDKKQYRFPTEAEWEYSCRAGATAPFYFGNTVSIDQNNFNGVFPYGGDKKGQNREKITPVGSFPANAFGLYDMHGNVWQWCQDWYGEYPQKDVIDPQGPDAGRFRVLRGGSFYNPASFLRSAYRNSNVPSLRTNVNGFRVAMTFTADEAKQGTPPAKETKEDQKPVDGSKEKQADEPKNKKQTETEKRIGKVILDEFDFTKGIIKARNYGGASFDISINPTTQITIDGKAATLAELKAIDLSENFAVMATAECVVDVQKEINSLEEILQAKIDDGGKTNLNSVLMGLFGSNTFKGSAKAIRIDVIGDQIEGVIKSTNIPQNDVTIARVFEKAKGTTIYSTYEIEKNAKVAINGKESKFADLKHNMQISLQFSVIKKNRLALEITALGPQVEGLVKTVDIKKSSISVHIINAQITAEAVSVTKDAKIIIDGKEGKLSDLKAGMRVTLQMPAELDESLVVGITAGKTAENK